MENILNDNTVRNLTMALGDGVCVTFAMAMALTLFGGTKRLKDDWYLPIGSALMTICINWLVIELIPSTAFLAIIFLGASLIYMAFLAIWWCKEGATILEMLPFFITGAIFYFSAENSVSQLQILTEIPEDTIATFKMIPTIFFISLIGIIFANFFFFNSRKKRIVGDSVTAICYGLIGVITAVAAIYTIVLGINNQNLQLFEWLQQLPSLIAKSPA